MEIMFIYILVRIFLDVIHFHHFHKRKGTDDLNSITEIWYELHINFKMGTFDIQLIETGKVHSLKQLQIAKKIDIFVLSALGYITSDI